MDNQAVKSLNKGPGKNRFKFKSFDEHLEEIDINVFRTLEPVKFEPSNGLSSFFHESLLQWRELNSAADFIFVYEELMPHVQTLPQILHCKKQIVDKLLSRVHHGARLSLEPILSLIAILSRDLQQEFEEFLPQIIKAFENLLRSGGDRDPEILEHIFKTISYILKYMQGILKNDVVKLMRMTKKLRHYHRDYVREFMAEAFSFLLRKTSREQLIKGVRKALKEAVTEPSEEKTTGCSALLWNILKGPSTKFHSRAEQVLKILLDKSTYSIEKLKSNGNNTVAEVVADTFRRLCEELKREELVLLWSCLLEEISSLSVESNACGENEVCLNNDFIHIGHLLFILNSVLSFRNGSKVNDYKPLFELAEKFIKVLAILSLKSTRQMNSKELLVSEIYRFLLSLVHNHTQVGGASVGPAVIFNVHSKWASLFKGKDSSLLSFLRNLLDEESAVICPFGPYIIRALNDFIKDYPADVIPLLVRFFEKLEGSPQYMLLSGKDDGTVMNIYQFISSYIENVTERIKTRQSASDFTSLEANFPCDPPMIWGVLKVSPHIFPFKQRSTVICDLAFSISVALSSETDTLYNYSRAIWESIMGTALTCYVRILKNDIPSLQLHLSNCLEIARKHKNSFSVLSAVADFLDAVCGMTQRTMNECNAGYHIDLRNNKTTEILGIFADNLGNTDKRLRLSTLRILSHYEPLQQLAGDFSERPGKKRRVEEVREDIVSFPFCKVVLQLLQVEETTLALDTVRKVTGIISTIQMDIGAGRLPASYMLPLLHSLVGVLHNRFSLLWDPVVECLAILLERNHKIVWSSFVKYLELNLNLFLTTEIGDNKVTSYGQGSAEVLEGWFKEFVDENSERTSVATIIILLLRTAQRVPNVAEALSQPLLNFFFVFLGYSKEYTSVDRYDDNKCKGKDWTSILKEWLTLIRGMKNSRSILNNQRLKEVLGTRLLEHGDSDIQQKVVECLLNWRDSYLVPYEEHVKNLISIKSVREEIVTWSLAKEKQHIEDCHRKGLIPMIIRILIPKIKKMKAVALRKSAGVLQRKALLRFLAQVEPDELALFFVQLFKSFENDEHYSSCGSKNSWEDAVKKYGTWDFIWYISEEKILSLPSKVKTGFLHVIKDVLEIFDRDRVSAFLIPSLVFLLHILQSCATTLEQLKVNKLEGSEMDVCTHESRKDGLQFQENRKESYVTRDRNRDSLEESNISLEKFTGHDMMLPAISINDGISVEEAHQDQPVADQALPPNVDNIKELRSLCLKVICTVLNKFETFDYGTVFWDMFFGAIKPLIHNFTQESGRSEVPSSLFTIFLVMSRNAMLAPFLLREKTLVPSILSVLSLKNISEAVVSTVLRFVENILSLEVDDEKSKDALLSEILLPHLDILFNSMQNIVNLHRDSKRRGKATLGRRELSIFRMLGKYATNSSVVDQFVDCLVGFLYMKSEKNKEVCMEILHVIQEVLPAIGNKTANKLLDKFSSLLSCADTDVRQIVCSILKGLSKVESSLTKTENLISDLNAISSSMVGEYDYDKRLAAYEKITVSLFSQISEQHALLILSQCIYDMSSDDMSIMHSGSKSLLVFVDFCSSILVNNHKLEEPIKQVSPSVEAKGETVSCINWSTVAVKRVIQKFLFSHLRTAFSKGGTSIQREWAYILRSMIINLPEISMLKECSLLSSTENLEVDFFLNIFHIQKHRRMKALLKFRKVLSESLISEATLMQLFVPLFFNFLLENKEDKDLNIANSSLETLGCISHNLGWESYFSLLLKTFRLIAYKPEHNKILVRLICSLLDNFHFGIIVSPNGSLVRNGDELETDKILVDTLAEGKNEENGIISPEIQNCLKTRVLPEINKMITSHRDVINVSVSRAALKVLKLLPSETLELELPRIIQQIANLLKSRADSLRDEARAALAACAKELGPQYLQFIIKIMQITLTRGYELHVLGYSVNYILSKLSSSLEIGNIDDCAKQLLEIAENDIMGEVSEEKEVGKIASKMKETKNSKSFDSLQIVAQKITFPQLASTLLVPVIRNLRKTLLPKAKAKIETMLRNLATGLQSNTSIDQKDLFVFVYGLIEDSMEGDTIKTDTNSLTKGTEVEPVPQNNHTKDQPSHMKDLANGFLITLFALQLMESYLKKLKIKNDDKFLISMLDPFVVLLQKSLKSKYEGVISYSLKCLIFLVRLPLPSISIHECDISSSVFDIILRTGKMDSPLVQPAISLLIVLLRHGNAPISNAQLQMLLQCSLFIDLERSPSSNALSLLKAIVKKKLLVPDLYDLIVKVSRLMITSQDETVRMQCSKILLQFLLDYPLGKNRLVQHLNFLLSNLNYEHASGREAALEMLHAIILKFPINEVDKQAEEFFMALVLSLVNDSSNQVRAMVGTVVKLLFGRISKDQLQRLLTFSLSWYLGENQKLWRPAGQVIGLLIEVMDKSFQHYVEDVRNRLQHILKCAVSAADDESLDATEATLPYWQEAYYSLIMMEKLIQHFPEVFVDKDFKEIWDCISSLLVHPHLWLRNCSTRLILAYITACTANTANTDLVKVIGRPKEETALLHPNKLFFLAASLCHQLDSDHFESSMSDIVTESLVYVISLLNLFIESINKTDLVEYFSTMIAKDQILILKSFSMIGTKSCRRAHRYLSNKQEETLDAKLILLMDLEAAFLEPVIRQLGKIAIQAHEVKTKVVFDIFKEFTTRKDCAVIIQRHAETIFLPLYKLSEGFAGKIVPGELKSLADVVLNQMKDTVGVEFFVQSYNSVRRKVKSSRDKRKQTEKIARIINPMRHAKKKKLLAARRQIQKKHKVTRMRTRH